MAWLKQRRGVVVVAYRREAVVGVWTNGMGGGPFYKCSREGITELDKAC
jgi:hypothetical protein